MKFRNYKGGEELQIRDYTILQPLDEAKHSKNYLARDGDGESVILKISKTFDDNHMLLQEARNFRLYSEVAELYDGDDDCDERGSSPSKYDLLFAKLEETFLEESQHDRRINIFSIRDINYNDLVPLSELHEKVKIDLRTSSWILGRLLKWYAFQAEVHRFMEENEKQFTYVSKEPEYYNFDPKDFLICPAKSRLIFYNGFTTKWSLNGWSNNSPKIISQYILDWVKTEKVKDAEKDYLKALHELVEKNTLTCRQFNYEEKDYESILNEIYKIISNSFGISYYPFTYCDKDDPKTWKKIEDTVEQL